MQDIENKPSITPSEEKLGGVHDSTVPTLPEAGIDGATSSAAARQQTFKYDEKDPAEGKLNTKFDWFIMVPVCIIYAFCFLDRINVGFAKINKMEQSLNMTGNDYNIGITVFYITYILVEVPSNLIGKKIGLGLHLSLCTVGFGLCTFCSAFVHNFGQFIVLRLLLGVFEGGMLPGIAYYLSRWYRRRALAQRMAVVLAVSNVGSAFGGLIATGIIKIKHIGWLTTWRNIFFIEGLVTMVVGIVLCFWLARANHPGQCRWLSQEEKDLAEGRLMEEYLATRQLVEPTKGRSIKQGVLNINTGLTAIYFLFVNIAVQGLAVFLPSIVTSLFPSKTPVQRSLLAVPPYFAASLSQLVFPYISMRIDRRAPLMCACIVMGIAGYAIFTADGSGPAKYAACFLCLMGFTPYGAFPLAWVGLNTAPDTTRAAAVAAVAAFGNIGGIISSWTFLPKEAPKYPTGSRLNLAGACIILGAVCAQWAYIKWENKQRDAGKRDHRLVGITPEDVALLGHKHPQFRYKE